LQINEEDLGEKGIPIPDRYEIKEEENQLTWECIIKLPLEFVR